jgi:hypothetical protein
LTVEPGIEIPLREFRFSFSRSAGPGGQNVNKVNTRVTLRWSVQRSPSLPEDLRQRFVARRRRLSGEASGHAARGGTPAAPTPADASQSRSGREPTSREAATLYGEASQEGGSRRGLNALTG